jgi:hypothetical protein
VRTGEDWFMLGLGEDRRNYSKNEIMIFVDKDPTGVLLLLPAQNFINVNANTPVVIRVNRVIRVRFG